MENSNVVDINDGWKYKLQREREMTGRLVKDLLSLIMAADEISITRLPNTFESRFIHQQLEAAIALLMKH